MSGIGNSDDLAVFAPFFEPDLTPTYRLTWPYSNPSYVTQKERFVNKSHLETYSEDEGGVRYESVYIFFRSHRGAV